MLSNAVLLTLILVLITSSLLLIIQRNAGTLIPTGKSGNKNKEPTFIIAGPSNGGKTCLFTLLTTGKVGSTVMSQEPNVTHHFKLTSTSKNSHVRLMEFPGHLKLRNKLIDTLKTSSNVKGLIFVVDATVDPKELTKTAEFLFHILQITERQPNGVDILLACNKSESFTARPPSKIKDTLEKEIEKIIARKQKSLDTVTGPIGSSSSAKAGSSRFDEGDAEAEEALLELELSSNFKFDSLEGNVNAIEGSVLRENIDNWECWINERAVN